MMEACGKKDPILEERMDNGIVKIYDDANQEYFTGYVENTEINKNGIKYTTNLTEQQQKDLDTVISAMKSLMVGAYIKQRKLAIRY